MTFRIRAAVLADDVRTESNGKHIYIGCYLSRVVCKTKPAMLSLNIVLHLDVDGTEGSLEVMTQGGGIETFRQISLHAELPEALFILQANIPVVEERDLSIFVRQPGKEWVPGATWKFIFDENAVAAPPEEAAEIIRFANEARNQ